MANPALLMQKKNGKYLWFALLGLGFEPDSAVSSIAGKTNITAKHINLGPNMFDRPNKDAFYIVTHFLLEKLNPTRFNEAYRHCWPVLNHKADAEFRKVTCAWLRDIMDETANAGSKVVASLFLSPGGPKLLSLMVILANHVMLQEMKTFTTDDSWVPEAAALPASSLDMAEKRLNLINARFLKTAVDQDRFLHKNETQVKLLVKSLRDIRAEGAQYDGLLKRYSSSSPSEGEYPAEKIKKVRSLWSTIDGMLSTTKEEQQAVESVLNGDVDRYILDGTDRVLKIPCSLLERVEQLPNQLSSGNVYEVGQLNLLCVLELTNHTLHLLKEERSRPLHALKAQLNPQHLQEKCQQMAHVLQNLHLIRQRISKEGIPEVQCTIRELEAEWDRKWMDTLKDTPLVSFLNEDPAPDLLSPMAPLSFDPAAETNYKSSVFLQYPAKLLDEKPAQTETQEAVTRPFNLLSHCSATAEKTESPVASTESLVKAKTSLEWLLDKPPSPVRASTVKLPQGSLRKTTNVPLKVKTKAQILDMECNNLADQFAEAVTTGSTEGSVKGRDLENFLSTLHGDPFSTRKQLPRTPESLIMDVKTSWRKALQEKEKMDQSAKFEDSEIGLLTPLNKPDPMLLSPAAPSLSVSCCKTSPVLSHGSPPVSKQDAPVKTTLLWDTFNTDDPDSRSGTGSSAVQFTLNNETLPEMPSCDSLLSLSDELVDDDYGELLLPSLKSEAKESPLTPLHLGRIQKSFEEVSMENRKRTPECLLSDHTVSGFGKDWLMEPAESLGATNKLFSLDLDTLEAPCSPKKQEYSFPTLITFSPIDDI